jgi:hypothetical protein
VLQQAHPQAKTKQASVKDTHFCTLSRVFFVYFVFRQIALYFFYYMWYNLYQSLFSRCKMILKFEVKDKLLLKRSIPAVLSFSPFCVAVATFALSATDALETSPCRGLISKNE